MTDVVIPPPERIKADVEHIKEWLSQEPHLAHIAAAEDEEWLETFLYNNKFSLEKTKYKLENLYSIRSKYSEIFKNRDPSGKDLLELRNSYKHVIWPETKDGLHVVMMRYEEDLSGFDATAYLKFTFMICDLAMLNKKARLVKFISILDCQHMKMGHIIKMSPVLNTLTGLSEKIYSLRPAAIHIINLPNFAQTFFEAATKLLPDKLRERIHFHATKNDLLNLVDEDVICSDFGGKGPSLAELQEGLGKAMEVEREWFETRGALRSNEELRPKDSKQPEEMRGSFRTLEVD